MEGPFLPSETTGTNVGRGMAGRGWLSNMHSRLLVGAFSWPKVSWPKALEVLEPSCFGAFNNVEQLSPRFTERTLLGAGTMGASPPPPRKRERSRSTDRADGARERSRERNNNRGDGSPPRRGERMPGRRDERRDERKEDRGRSSRDRNRTETSPGPSRPAAADPKEVKSEAQTRTQAEASTSGGANAASKKAAAEVGPPQSRFHSSHFLQARVRLLLLIYGHPTLDFKSLIHLPPAYPHVAHSHLRCHSCTPLQPLSLEELLKKKLEQQAAEAKVSTHNCLVQYSYRKRWYWVRVEDLFYLHV